MGELHKHVIKILNVSETFPLDPIYITPTNCEEVMSSTINMLVYYASIYSLGKAQKQLQSAGTLISSGARIILYNRNAERNNA